MAKPITILVKMVHKETGYFKVVRKNSRNITGKLRRRCYIPRLRKHDWLEESKMK